MRVVPSALDVLVPRRAGGVGVRRVVGRHQDAARSQQFNLAANEGRRVRRVMEDEARYRSIERANQRIVEDRLLLEAGAIADQKRFQEPFSIEKGS